LFLILFGVDSERVDGVGILQREEARKKKKKVEETRWMQGREEGRKRKEMRAMGDEKQGGRGVFFFLMELCMGCYCRC
jgi:hypothetical protein